jgi:Uma2 family endonuclease
MATATTIPVEQYLGHAGSWEPDAEYVDGVIEERPMGEYDHNTWRQAIELWFVARKIEWNIRVRVEQRVQVSPTRFRVPDVVVWSRSRAIEQILTIPPLAVFEVLSPEDRMSSVLHKLGDYSNMGIPTIRVVDPEQDLIYRYLSGKLELVLEPVESIPECAGILDWNAIRQLLDD